MAGTVREVLSLDWDALRALGFGQTSAQAGAAPPKRKSHSRA